MLFIAFGFVSVSINTQYYNHFKPKSIGGLFLFSVYFTLLWWSNNETMAKRTRKPTNKAKFSLYLDKTLMGKVSKMAEKLERSVNFVVEKSLEKEFI